MNNRKKKKHEEVKIIIQLWNHINRLRKAGKAYSRDCISLEEKAIICYLICQQKKLIKAPPFNLQQEIMIFVQARNKSIMSIINNESLINQNHVFDIIRALNMLEFSLVKKSINKSMHSELLVLTLNNLSCLYRTLKKLPMALSVINQAILIEKKEYHENNPAIITTILNKVAILNNMGRHYHAINELSDALKVIKGIDQKKDCDCSYLKMLIYYNLGVQNQHILMRQSAMRWYKKGSMLAQNSGNDEMIQRFKQALRESQ